MSNRAFHETARSGRRAIADRDRELRCRRSRTFGWPAVLAVAAAVLSVAALASPAHAEDFFSALFGAIGRGFRPPPNQPPFGSDAPSQAEPAQPPVALGGPAWCVRTCDGRYFPLPSSDQSRALSCHNFCPAADTKVVYGASIDGAATEDGKPYSQLPNAFRYRNELVAGCTCNGHDVGLASIPIQDDPTLRSGDLVEGPHGPVAADGDVGPRASLGAVPAPDAGRVR